MQHAQLPSKQPTASVTNNGNSGVDAMIERLQDVLNFLDENDMAIAAIRIEEAINTLKLVKPESPDL